MRGSFRRGLSLGLLGAAVLAALKALAGRRRPPEVASEPPAWPPLDVTPTTEEATTLPPWIESVDGACPATHPVKAKLASQIFHVDGGLSYARTRPDRCYLDAAAAQADGLRPAKR